MRSDPAANRCQLVIDLAQHLELDAILPAIAQRRRA
jgi:hypothetical protein